MPTGGCDSHCRRCVSSACRGGGEHTGCPVVTCVCGVTMHGCKLADHSMICGGRARPCLCAQYGCRATLLPHELASHLEQCVASPVICYLCSRLLLRCELGPHLEHTHREHEGTVFQHCPLRDIQGCGFCVVRQRPICCSAALHAVAADTRGDNLRRILEWRRVSQPAHLVEFTRGRTCPLRTEGLIVSWSSTTGVGVSARTHQQLKEDGGRADSHLLGMASASAVHGTLNPPPIPTVIPAPTYTAAAGASGDGVAGLLSLPDDALNAVVSLIITPAAGSSSGSDTLSVACLGASCRRLNRLCQQHLPALLSYRWEPLPSPPPAPPLTPSSQADAVAAGGASPSRLTRLAAQFPELELWQQQETTAVMTMEHNPSPELLHRLRRLASTSSIDDDDDDGPTMAPPPPLDTPLTDASADDLVALFPNGVPARFRPVRRWQPNHELISVGRVGAPPSALQWQMTGDTMGGHLQDCIRRHEAAEEADASMGFLNVEKAHDASESERGSTGVSGLSLLRSMVHAHQDELEAWRRRIAEKTLINHFNCSQ